MTKYTSYQDRYFAEQLLLKRPQSSYDSLASAMSGVKVDLNPHQVDAALFAMQSPLSSGVLMADEVGLGKTKTQYSADCSSCIANSVALRAQ